MAKKSAKKSKGRIRDLAAEAPREHTPRYIAGQDEEGPILSGVAFGLLSVLALVALAAAAVFFGTPQVEAAVERDAVNFVRRAGFDRVIVDATGQEVLLLGTVADQEDLVALPQAVAGVPGVTAVVSELEVEIPEEEEGPAPSDPLVISVADGVLTITGTMPDQATVDRIVASLGETGNEVDAAGLVVRERVPPVDAWLAAVLSISDRLDSEVETYEIVANPESGVATVSAEFDSRQTRADIRRQAEDLFTDSPLAFVSALTMVDAPPPPPRQQVVELQEDLDDLISGKVIEFEFNSDVLTRSGRRLLADIVEALRQFPEVPVEIAGHADAVGTPEANMELSRRRAQAVVDYLVTRGEDPNRFVVTAYGDTRPIASNDTEEGRARNRRIEFIALEE